MNKPIIKLSDAQKRRWRKEKSMLRIRICEDKGIQAEIEKYGLKKWLYWKKQRVVWHTSPPDYIRGISTSPDDWY